MFLGLRNYLWFRRNKHVPMSLFWEWLAAKWEHDLKFSACFILNPHIVLMFILHLIANLIIAIIENKYVRMFKIHIDFETPEQRMIDIVKKIKKYENKE